MNSPRTNSSPSFKHLRSKQKQSPIAIKEKMRKVCKIFIPFNSPCLNIRCNYRKYHYLKKKFSNAKK